MAGGGFAIVFASGFCVDLRAALGAGNNDFSLAHRYPADGFALLAGEIFMFLVSVAGSGAGAAVFQAEIPVDPLLVFRPSFVEVLGKATEEDEQHQREQQRLADSDGQTTVQERKDKLHDP